MRVFFLFRSGRRIPSRVSPRRSRQLQSGRFSWLLSSSSVSSSALGLSPLLRTHDNRGNIRRRLDGSPANQRKSYPMQSPDLQSPCGNSPEVKRSLMPSLSLRSFSRSSSASVGGKYFVFFLFFFFVFFFFVCGD